MKRKERILQIFNLWRVFPAWVVVNTSKNNKLILDELDYWDKCAQTYENKRFNSFSRLIIGLKEYRSLLVYRLSGGGKHIVKFLFPPMETLYINTKEIGPRLFIQHGFATNISAKSIGSDCWVNQQVTIGYTFDPEPPVIGNGVRISAGAKVVGQITLEDNSIVAANAAVVKDVPENAVVGGVPAKIIGENKEHRLYKK